MIYNFDDFSITYVPVTHEYLLPTQKPVQIDTSKCLLNVQQAQVPEQLSRFRNQYLHSIKTKQKSLFCLYSQNQ